MVKKNLNIIIEKLSLIDIEKTEDSFILRDRLQDKNININNAAHDICFAIDGCNSLKEISNYISEEYGISQTQAEDDVWEFYKFLKSNKLILCKKTLTYSLIKLYYTLVFGNKKI